MLSLSTIDQNVSGNVVIKEDPKSNFADAEARITRTACLDGSVVVDHRGFFHGDRTFDVSARLSESDTSLLKALFQTQTILTLSCTEGCFEVVIRRLSADGGEIQMTILIKEKKNG